MSNPHFTRCESQTECLGEAPCDQEDLQLGGACSTSCLPAVGSLCHARASAGKDWLPLLGFAGHYPCGIGDVDVGTYGTVSGTRLSPIDFQIQGTVQQGGITPKTVEIALFRYKEDPSAFDGLDVTSVFDLVDLGLITAQDVLFVTTIDGFGSILEIVDVTGMADDELVLLAAGNGPFPSETGCELPALGLSGAVLLAAAFLVLGPRFLRSRRR